MGKGVKALGVTNIGNEETVIGSGTEYCSSSLKRPVDAIINVQEGGSDDV